MRAKQQILDLWQKAVMYGIGVTFSNTYGHATGRERYFETVDAYSREDDVRIVKSIDQLKRDLPPTDVMQHWPALLTLFELQSHTLDDDYPAHQRVASATRDPRINMHSEPVTEQNVMDDVEPCDNAFNYAKLKGTLNDPA